MDLAQKIAMYQPDEAAKKIVSATKIVLLVGISGAGKDTIKHQLLDQPGFMDIVSHTTRAPRENRGVMERDGEAYHFISEATASDMIDRHEFVEVKFVHGTIYGTSVAAIKRIKNAGNIATTDIDVQGVDEYKKISQKVVAIFILPPSYQEWRRRLRARYSTEAEFTEEWRRRYPGAIQELTHALEVPYYHFVINDNLDEAVRIVGEIAKKPDVYNRKDDEARLAARDLLDELIKAN